MPVLLKILQTTEWMSIVHDRAISVLHEEIPDLAFDAALEIFDRTEDEDLKGEMAGIIANGGRGKPGVFERLIKFFRQSKGMQDLLAGYLADLGDRRALPELHAAFRKARDPMARAEFEEAITRLGGELDALERRVLERDQATPWLGPAAVTTPPMAPAARTPLAPTAKPQPVRVTKVGRNQPCPCGSGKKYKKCCGR